MIKIFDSHSHYNNAAFDKDYQQILSHLTKNNVGYVMNCGSDVETSIKAMHQSQSCSFMYFSAGIHPIDTKNITEKDLLKIKEIAQDEKCVAIGEIGLDYHYDDMASPEWQKKIFTQQLDMAIELNLPVIIHIRDAMQDAIDILKCYSGKLNGVIHCFSGSVESCTQLVKMGFYIGFTGVVTFKNARKSLECLKIVPKDKLLIETDCPYMAPEPFRCKRCDSSMLHYVSQKIADELSTDKDSIIKSTCENAKRLFNIK